MSLALVPAHATGDVFPASDWNVYLQGNLNWFVTPAATIASATTIAPTSERNYVTGTTPIATITLASPVHGQTVKLQFAAGNTVLNNGGGTGNVRTLSGLDRVVLANEIVEFWWDATRSVLQESGGAAAGGVTIATSVAGLGAGVNGKQGLVRVMPATYSTGALALPAATITVGDTIEFPSAGTLSTPNGVVTYTGKTATTFTGCTGGTGTLAANATVQLATGATTPATEVALVYDAVLGKWVSQEVAQLIEVQTNSGAYTEGFNSGGQSLNGMSPATLRYRQMVAAGLSPQVRWEGALGSNGSSGTAVTGKLSYRTQNNGGGAVTAPVDIANTTIVRPTAAAGSSTFIIPWLDPFGGSPPTVADILHIISNCFGNSSSGGGSNFSMAGPASIRWVG